jgi:hypothetical protein
MTNKDNLENFIKESNKRSLQLPQRREFRTSNGIQVYIKDPVTNDVDIEYVFETIENSIPRHLFYNVELIFVGQFEEFLERDVNALYKDNAIYVTNEQTDEEDMIDDITHEISHSIEDFAGDEIYGDNLVKYEFLGKRKKLFHLLKNENFHVFEEDFLNPHYSREFDEFLYKEVGYPLLANLTMGLFVSPYATTALKEYFAVGFEEYFLKDRKYLKTLCPHLFQKIDFISNIQPED